MCQVFSTIKIDTRVTVVSISINTLRLEHWDVNNEDLHGDFFERHTGNPNVTMQMFRDIHAVDPNVKLFLNDYAIMTMEGDNKATVRQTLFMRKPL